MKLNVLLTCAILVLAIPAFARENSIEAMVIGGSTLELTNTRQITTRADGAAVSTFISPDGRIVAGVMADIATMNMTAFMVSSEGGRPHVIVDGAQSPGADESAEPGDESWIVNPLLQMTWSPDGKLLAIPASHSIQQEEGRDVREGIALFNRSEILTGAFLADKNVHLESSALWDQNGLRFAVVCSQRDPETHKLKRVMTVYNSANGEVQRLPLSDDFASVEPDHWTNDGRHLTYVAHLTDGSDEIREIGLDKMDDKVVINDFQGGVRSPDGAHAVSETGGSLYITSLIAGVPSSEPAIYGKLVAWSPSGKLFLYSQTMTISDEVGKRTKEVHPLWLRSFEDHHMNHLLVSVDSGPSVPVPSFASCSSDCTRVAYVSQQSVYVAELSRRASTPSEKLAAKIPLSEEEMKDLVTSNAKEIALGMIEYTQDYDGNFPGSDTFPEDLTPYVTDPDVFNQPGTGTNILKYSQPQNMNEIKDYAGTVIGTMDAGYGWVVVIYADGHVIVQPK
jgi:hypothetical protein